jgi:serine/threonine-protein kinase HipA
LYEKNQTRLAPFYDLISTASFPKLQHRMAMKIGKSYDPEHTKLAHWHEIVANTSTAKSYLNLELKKFATKLPKAAAKLQKKLESEGINSPAFTAINNIIDKRSARILGYFEKHAH